MIDQTIKEEPLVKQTSESNTIEDTPIEILGHSLVNGKDRRKDILLELKNITEADIGETMFEAFFYDAAGNVLDTVDKSMSDLKKGDKRFFRIESSLNDGGNIESYEVKILKIDMTPLPIATGNDKVNIIKHSLETVNDRDLGRVKTVDLYIRNVSEKTIATMTFKLIFYDSVGKVLDTMQHKEFELKPYTSRKVIIFASNTKNNLVRSYEVTIPKVVTADVEKIRLCGHRIRTIQNGNEEIEGTVKNISDVKTDTALVATFKDSKDEKLGVKVIEIKDIEPGGLKKFHYIFTPSEGEKVKTYSLDIGEIAEGVT